MDPASCPWTCHRCQEMEKRSIALEEEISIPSVSGEESRKATFVKKSSLRIIQWNAEGYASKVFELAARLDEDEIDICLIQESKLSATSAEPYIKGYKTIRADRVAAAGGGLLAFVKQSLVMEVLGTSMIEATEISSFRARVTKRKWVTFSNVYIPPRSSYAQVCKARLDMIPTSK